MLELRRWKTNLIKKFFFKISYWCHVYFQPVLLPWVSANTVSSNSIALTHKALSEGKVITWMFQLGIFQQAGWLLWRLEFNHHLHPDLIKTKRTVSESWQLSVTWLLSGCSECVALKTSCGCTFLRSSLVCVTLFTISLLLGDYFVHLCYRVGVFHANCTAVHLRPK